MVFRCFLGETHPYWRQPSIQWDDLAVILRLRFRQSVKSIANLASYVQFDNFEITGVCWSNVVSGNPGMVNTGSNDVISNDWWHGWTMTSMQTDTMGMTSNSSNVTFDHDIFDGSDAPHWPAGNGNCSGGTSCTTGVGTVPSMFRG